MKPLVSLLLCLMGLFTARAAAGQDFGWQRTNGPGGGDVWQVFVDPEGQLFVQAGHFVFSTFYRAPGEGQAFEQVDGLTGRVQAFAAGPGPIRYAATGERLFRSDDAGRTWERDSGGPDGVFDLAAEPGGTLLAGTSNGVYRYTPATQTWTRLALRGQAVGFVATAGGATVVAALTDAVLRSTDGGATWRQVARVPTYVSGLALDPDGSIYFSSTPSGQPWQPVQPGYVFRIDRDGGSPIPIAFTDDPRLWFTLLDVSAEGHLYVGSEGRGEGYRGPGGLYRSTDGGATWTLLGLERHAVSGVAFASSGTLYAAAHGFLTDTGPWLGGGLMATDDDGRTWRRADALLPASRVFDLQTTPEGALLAGTGDGLHVSADGGTTWRRVLDAPDTVTVGLARQTAACPGSVFVAVAVPDHPGTPFLYRSADGGATWTVQSIPGSDSQRSNEVLCTDAGYLFVFTDGVYRSADYGQTWELLESVPGRILPDGQGRLLAATGQAVYESSDHGTHWTRTEVPGVPDLVGLAANGDMLYAATLYETYRLRREDGTWTAVRIPGADGWWDDLVVDAEGNAYGARSDVIAMPAAEDRAETLPAPIEYVQVLSLAVGADGHLYAGTDGAGVFRSTRPVATSAAEAPRAPAASVAVYPNPFAVRTTLSFTLDTSARVTLGVYDLLGRAVAVLVDGQALPAGAHEAVWEAGGRPAGVYFYKLIAGGAVKAGPMVVVR